MSKKFVTIGKANYGYCIFVKHYYGDNSFFWEGYMLEVFAPSFLSMESDALKKSIN